MNIFDYSKVEKEYVACNICGSTSHSKLFFGDRYNMGIQTVACNNCGLIFINPRPKLNFINDFYANYYRDFYTVADFPDEKYIQRLQLTKRAEIIYNHVVFYILDLLKKSNELKVLDVGCGEGSFLRLLKQKHKDKIKLFGIEPTINYAKFASNYSEGNIFNGSLEEYLNTNNQSKKFDLIILNHVLEHFLDPLKALKQIHEIISEKGILFIEVPNILGNWSGIFMFHIAHLYQFYDLTLENLLKIAGFNPIKVDKSGNEVHQWAMSYICQKSSTKSIVYPSKKMLKTNKLTILNKLRQNNNKSFKQRLKQIAKQNKVYKKLSLLRNKLNAPVHRELEQIKIFLEQIQQDVEQVKIAQDQKSLWLYQNREERMDATRSDIFDSTRAEFHLARYRFACDYIKDKIVADIACGTGYGTDLLRVRGGAKKVIGVDIDSGAIRYASENHAPHNVSYICSSGDATGIDDQSIDVVVSFETIEHIPSDTELLHEFHRILKPNGMLICSTPNQWPIEVSDHHLREYNRESFEEVLSKYFKDITLYNQNSGTDSPFNCNQSAGICLTTSENEDKAECYIAIGQKRKL